MTFQEGPCSKGIPLIITDITLALAGKITVWTEGGFEEDDKKGA